MIAGVLLVLVTVLGLTGCTVYLLDTSSMIPDPPPLAQAAPRLSGLEITPSTLRAGAPNELTVRVRYEDWNRDVGPDRVRVRREVEAVSGNLAFSRPMAEYTVSLASSGRVGLIEYGIDIAIPSHGYGQIRVSIAIYDERGQLSEPVSTVLTIR